MKQFAASILPVLAFISATPALGQPSGADVHAAIAEREEAMARTVGTLAVIYGYPAIDYLRLMRENTSPADPRYAPVNAVFSEGHLTEPGERAYSDGKARSPNHDTLYFRSWIDLRAGPQIVSVPDTHDRYYTLTFADFYSEVQHTGRRTTGTAAQKILLIGPGWRGEVPAGMVPVRIRTDQVLMLGRMLARPGNDEGVADGLIKR